MRSVCIYLYIYISLGVEKLVGLDVCEGFGRGGVRLLLAHGGMVGLNGSFYRCVFQLKACLHSAKRLGTQLNSLSR